MLGVKLGVEPSTVFVSARPYEDDHSVTCTIHERLGLYGDPLLLALQHSRGVASRRPK